MVSHLHTEVNVKGREIKGGRVADAGKRERERARKRRRDLGGGHLEVEEEAAIFVPVRL